MAPGGAEEDSCLRESNRHLHLGYNEEEEEVQWKANQPCHQGLKLLEWNGHGAMEDFVCLIALVIQSSVFF